MWKHFKSWGEALISFIYTPLCLECRETLLPAEKTLCSACREHLVLLDPSNRCPRCFLENAFPHATLCIQCQHNPSPFKALAACWEYAGPAATVTKALKYGGLPHLAKGISAAMLIQIHQLDWPLPDLVVPVPIPFAKKFERGFNQSALIAEDLSEQLHCPMHNILKRSNDTFSQAGLLKSQRLQQPLNSFSLKNKSSVTGKTVLLIDDVYTTGTTIQNCALRLLDGFPRAIYVMTACRAMNKQIAS